MQFAEKYFLITAERLSKGSNKKYSISLFNPDTNRGFAIEGLAAIFCSRLDGSKKISELINEMEIQFELERGIFNIDVDNLLEEMLRNGLVTSSSEPIISDKEVESQNGG